MLFYYAIWFDDICDGTNDYISFKDNRVIHQTIWITMSLGDFLYIPTQNTGQLNPLFHTFAEFRLIVNRIIARQSIDWLAANAQFSPNECRKLVLFDPNLLQNLLQWELNSLRWPLIKSLMLIQLCRSDKCYLAGL